MTCFEGCSLLFPVSLFVISVGNKGNKGNSVEIIKKFLFPTKGNKREQGEQNLSIGEVRYGNCNP
jgi:hypothetical protein